MPNVEIWKGPVKLATGAMSAASASVTSVARIQERTSPSVRRIISNWTRDRAAVVSFSGNGRNVSVMVTSGANTGRVFRSRVIVDAGTEAGTLTLADKCPFA